MGKLNLSSGEADDLEHLQDVIFLMHDTLGIKDPPANTRMDLMNQLDHATYELATSNVDLTQRFSRAVNEVLRLTSENTYLENFSNKCSKVLDQLCYPPLEDRLLDKVLATLKREGNAQPVIKIYGEACYQFRDSDLREAIKVSIAEYNNEIVSASFDP